MVLTGVATFKPQLLRRPCEIAPVAVVGKDQRPPQEPISDPELQDLEVELLLEEHQPIGFKALILAVKIQVHNASEKAKWLRGMRWQSEEMLEPEPDIDQEIARLARGKPELHAALGPGETQVFWAFQAFRHRSRGGEPGYSVFIRDEVGHEYGVTRSSRPARTYLV